MAAVAAVVKMASVARLLANRAVHQVRAIKSRSERIWLREPRCFSAALFVGEEGGRGGCVSHQWR